jgi:hypothetical protein
MIPVANANLGPRYETQVGLVAALNTNLDDTIMELQDLRDQQDEDRREIKRLKAVIAGQDEEEVQEDGERWPAMSPRPRRTSYGSLRSRTRIIWPYVLGIFYLPVIESVLVRTTRWIGVLASGVFECLIYEHV